MYDVLAPSRGYSSLWGVIHSIYSFFYRWGRDQFTMEHHFNSLAGVGTFALEYTFLTLSTGQERYREASNQIFQLVQRYRRNESGMIPNDWDVMQGTPMSTNVGFASGGDSFYEYLWKTPLLVGCDQESLQRGDVTSTLEECDDASRSMMSLYLNEIAPRAIPAHTNSISDKLYPVDGSHYHHLLCFLPGLLALEGSSTERISLAKELGNGCHSTYRNTKTGLGPEEAHLHDDAIWITDSGYHLRPEHVESLFVLYRNTGDPRYQDMAWEVFTSIMDHCRTPFGFSSLANVNDPGSQTGDMPSYFLAETLKYLLLIFAPDDYVSLKDFVFSTEAHPLRRRHWKRSN